MAHVYTLPSSHGHPYYELSQLAAFAVYVALLLAQGQRRGYPWRQWLPLVATSTLALIVGCQLVALAPSNWLGWLRGDAALVAAVADGPRSILGGATASLLAVMAVRRALGFRGWGVLDAFGAPLCWALAVQCVGCLLVGCCWGEATLGASWGLAYGPGTLPYVVQQARGLLPLGAAHSLPLVPVQLVALLLCAGAGLVLHAVRRRAGWPPGSRYLLALGLLMLTRFTIDFWRDPASEPLGGVALTVAGCTLLRVQWLMLLGTTLVLGGWAWLVRQPRVAPTPPAWAGPGQPTLVALGLLVANTRLAPSTLSAAETLLLQALLLAVLLAEARAWLVALGQQLPRLAGLPLGALLAVALVGSTAQAPAPQQPVTSSEDAPTKTITLSGGVLGNYHEAQEDILESNQGCSGSQPLVLQQRVRAAGAEVAITTASSPTHSSTWGGGIWLGEQQVAIQTLPNSTRRFIANDTTIRYFMSDIHLYKEGHFGHDWLSAGVRLGAHLGSLGYFSYFDSGNARGTTFLMPELMLSLGNPRLLYGQADFCYGAENTLGAYTTRISLGSGLGQTGGSTVLAGYAHSPHYPSPSLAFVSASLRLPSGTGLSAVSLEPYFATDFAKHNIFSLKASYRLGK
ncbi:prolipoprotein diacylglyceryl transferase family protein [Hymenobacter bucti]|uniref:Prolipoprotein diacylglyceryl transferase family protein n=1 Tax=Hymenobacter bucti TaxID=1844114 RepID=A0ABW4QWX8_9BACT